MKEKKQEREEEFPVERRTGKDRRTGKLDEKYRYSVQAGFFLDMRRGERRRGLIDDPLISLN